MKQVAQRPRDGRVLVVDVPPPHVRPGWVLVRNRFSLISAGTERGKIELGRKRLLEKARARPDLVRKTVERARTDGIASTISVVRDRLAGLDPLGYSSAGIVEAVGERVEGLRPGDRVACGGAGWANHAGLVLVPKHLVAAVPETVDLSAAAFATVGAIAMHSVRQSEARLGERVGVIGLGLVGQLVLRILLAAGCTPVGIDRDAQATALGARAGATTRMRDEPGLERSIVAAADGAGLDSVIVCAATRSADPVDLACRLLRQRGRVVVLGDVPVEASRSTMYEKELEIRLSRSYGPGRYSAEYELHGQDLPIEYVRWTEQRNLQAFIELLESGRLDPSALTTHRFPVDSAEHAYAAVEASEPRAFGVLLEYQDAHEPTLVSPPPSHAVRRSPGDRIGLIGAGSFARSVLLPALAEMGVTLESVASDTGLSATDVAHRFGFARSATAEQVIADDRVDAVVIATRHSSHAELAAAALRAGKAVFVEKPPALTEEELIELELALPAGRFLMTGFNRRFAPMTAELKALLDTTTNRMVSIRVNAGALPPDHWLNDPLSGGGRLLGEGCHFIDLLAHCIGETVDTVHALALPQHHRPSECSESFVVTLRFAGGSLGTLLYTDQGDPRMGKERIEAYGSGQSATIDDFRHLDLYRDGRRSTIKRRADKGHRQQFQAFIAACRDDAPTPTANAALASMRATLAAAESLRTGTAVRVG